MTKAEINCEVAGCDNQQQVGSDYCKGHHALRNWLRHGKSLTAFLACHRWSNRNHGQPMCRVPSCYRPTVRWFEIGPTRSRVCHDKECSYHAQIRRGENPKAPPETTDYSLPISLGLPSRAQPLPICQIPGCGQRCASRDVKNCPEHTGKTSLSINPNSQCYISGACAVPGCARPKDFKDYYKGRKRYYRICRYHRKPGNPVHYTVVRETRKTQRPIFVPINPLNRNECSICHWQGPCDKHRMRPGKDGGTYERVNVIVVCPNCHRLLHRGIDPRTRQTLMEAVA